MKAAVWLGERKLVVKDVEDPSPGPGEVVVRVRWAGVCGTDLAMYEGRFFRAKPPVVLGHEFSGEIAQSPADNLLGVREGDAVVAEPLLPCGRCYACRTGMYNMCENFAIIGVEAPGCFAQYVKVKASSVHVLPSGLSMELAALAEPTAVAFHAVTRSGMRIGDSVAILGGGPIGVLVAEVARVGGAGVVIVSEVSPWRADFSRKLGFNVIMPDRDDLEKRVRDLTNGRGADVVFDAAGAPAAASQFTRISRPGGRIVVVGMYKDVISLDLRVLTFRELTMVGSHVYRYADFEKAVHFILKDSPRLSSIITEKKELNDIESALGMVREGRAMKVLIRPS